jgi:hypothetical protein
MVQLSYRRHRFPAAASPPTPERAMAPRRDGHPDRRETDVPVACSTASSPAGITPQAAPSGTTESAASSLALAERYLSPALSPLVTMGIVFVVAIFILLQREDLRDRLIRLCSARPICTGPLPPWTTRLGGSAGTS